MNLQNNLHGESSPYLLQHKSNPVWWQPWGQEAFDLAKKYDKPIFLSVGYSTCHWCHVMEEESFEKQDVADVLNKNFISIKVDREERPDIDEIYMQAVQALSGHGGWPMSVWLTHDLKPFFGATYFPKESFIQALNQITEAWKNQRQLILEDSSRLYDYLSKSLSLNMSEKGKVTDGIFLEFHRSFADSFDERFGGFGGAPKFPASMQLMALMRIIRRSGNSEGDFWVNKTLQEMCYRGLYDHTNGGFHRYSTDEQWIVPHFEKMLYDNALLSLVYIEAYQKYKNEEYRLVAEETLNYIAREMTTNDGGFYSAQDADSVDLETKHKEEGSFALWSYAELKEVLSAQEFGRLNDVFDLTIDGNFEGKNILVLRNNCDFLQRSHVRDILAKLSEIRQSRPQPHLDDKVLTEWNGLMIASFARASRVLDEPKYLSVAVNAAQFIFSKLYKSEHLYRCYGAGKSKIRGFSEDYAALVHACIELYQATFDELWYERALTLQAKMDELFWDSMGEAYFKTDGRDTTVITRTKPSYDGVTPNPNSLASYNLMRLYHLSYDQKYYRQAKKLFETFKAHLEFAPQSLSFMMLGLDLFHGDVKEVVISADSPNTALNKTYGALNKAFSPTTLFAFGPSKIVGASKNKRVINGQTTFYLCENQTCKEPTNDISLLITLI